MCVRTTRTTRRCSFLVLSFLLLLSQLISSCLSCFLQKRDPRHYETASISFVVGDRDPLYTLLRKADAIDDGAEPPFPSE